LIQSFVPDPIICAEYLYTTQ